MDQLSEYERITLLKFVRIGNNRRSMRDARKLFKAMFPNKTVISMSSVNKF